MSIWTENMKSLGLAEAERWLGVPHRNRMADIRIGIDCIHYVSEICVAAGLMDRQQLPEYDVNMGVAKVSTLLENAMIAKLHVEGFDSTNHEPEFGDVVVFDTGGLFSAHCGWYTGKHLYHSLAKRCVTRSEWKHWQHKAKIFVRFYSKGFR